MRVILKARDILEDPERVYDIDVRFGVGVICPHDLGDYKRSSWLEGMAVADQLAAFSVMRKFSGATEAAFDHSINRWMVTAPTRIPQHPRQAVQ